VPNALKPERDFCASCGFPLRGHRCEACGRGREPLAFEDGRRQEVHAETDIGDTSGLERAIEAHRAQDFPRLVGHVITAEGGATVRSVPFSEGPGWIAVIRGAPVFVSIHAEARELSIESPVSRVPRVQRVPVLRLALELAALELVGARFCLRDDLLLLRYVSRLDALSPVALRHVLRDIGMFAGRFAEFLAVSFEARLAVTEEQRGSVGFDVLGQAKRLRFGPGTGRSAKAGARRNPSTAPEAAPRNAPPEAPARPTAPSDVPPKPAVHHVGDTRPPARVSAAPPPAEASDGASPRPRTIPPPSSGEARRSEVATAPMRRPSVKPPALDASAAMAPASEPLAHLHSSVPPVIPAPPPVPMADRSLPREERRRNARTIPEPTRLSALVPPVPAMPAVRPAAGGRPMIDLQAPSRRPTSLIPAVTGENALLPADRLAAMLRQAQALASLTLDARPASLSWLVRATVFRAVYEYRDAIPDAVAHLYRCTGIGQGGGEPALLVMERIAVARCQVQPEKPLTIEPFTTAPQAKEHVARYIVEIDRSPGDGAFRHFLALGALSELLVRAKLPGQTEQRLREIVTFAQREGAKASAFDLMMTSLQRISGG
jgi:hypothetical protein